MKKLLSVLIIFSFVLVGCTASTSDSDPCKGKESKIGMVTDAGGVNDQSFNQST